MHRRQAPIGGKAGALQTGFDRASGDFVAIFDADFMPPADFLLRTIPLLIEDSELAFVQSRWGFINRGQNLLTRVQAAMLDEKLPRRPLE